MSDSEPVGFTVGAVVAVAAGGALDAAPARGAAAAAAAAAAPGAVPRRGSSAGFSTSSSAGGGEDELSGGAAAAPKALAVHQWLVLLSLNVIGPFASDAYLPNLPNIECDLATSSENASLTIQVNWLVLGLLNPVIGSLSDRCGYYPPARP